MSIEQIKNLIANTIKVQPGGGPMEPTCIPSLALKALMHSTCHVAINAQNSSNLMERATQNSMLRISLAKMHPRR